MKRVLMIAMVLAMGCDDESTAEGNCSTPPVPLLCLLDLDPTPDAAVDAAPTVDLGPESDAVPVDDGGPVEDAMVDAAPEVDAGPPACDFPAPRRADSPEAAALAVSPARCGMDPYAWGDFDDLGEVIDRVEVQRLPVGALNAILGAAGIEVPRPLLYDVIIEQIVYVTQDRGQRIEATAMVGHPIEPGPDAPTAIFTLLHGTAGFSDDCAPSNGLEYRGLVAAFASTGFTVVAPDYIGMKGRGEPTGFLHPYLVGEPTAIATLDSIRAVGRIARDGGRCVDPEVMIFGGSQGGHAALWTELLAPYYADELVIRGTVATVPPSDIVRQMELAIASRIEATFNALGLLVAGGQWYGLSHDEVLQPPLDTLLPEVAANSCDYGDLALDPADFPDAESVFTPALLQAVDEGTVAEFGPWGCLMAESSLLDTSVPRWAPAPRPDHGVLYVLGEADELVNTPLEREAFDTLCGMGWPLVYLECARAEHGPTTQWALPEVFDFIDARLAGEPIAGALCQRGPAVACRGEPME